MADYSQWMPGGSSFNATAPAGFDATKWADPNKSDPKYNVGRILAGGGTPEDAAASIGGKYLGKDLIQMSDGTTVDIYKDYGGAGQAVQWNPWDNGPGGSGGGSNGSGVTMSGVMGGAGGPIGAGTMSNLPGLYGMDKAGSLYDLLMKRAGQNIVPDAKDPIIANQTNAFNASETRNMRSYMNNLAEKGGPNANLGAQGRQTAEKVAQDTGSFQGTLMQNELNARRGEVENALKGAYGLLTAEQELQLRQQLASLDNALSYAQLGEGARQFDTTRQDKLGGV